MDRKEGDRNRRKEEGKEKVEKETEKESEGMKVFSKIINTELITSELLARGEIL